MASYKWRGSHKFYKGFENELGGFIRLDSAKIALTLVANRALMYTPRDRGTLQRSQSAYIDKFRDMISLTIEYDDPKATNIHELPPTGWNEKYRTEKNPSASHLFLKRALDEKGQEALDFLASEPLSKKPNRIGKRLLVLKKGRTSP